MGVPLNYNYRNLLERKATTLMTALGIAMTVAVLITSLGLAAGLSLVFESSGSPKQLLVLRQGSSAELTSVVTNESFDIIRDFAGIEKGKDGVPLVSQELMAIVNLASVEAKEGMNVTIRGVTPVGVSMRKLQIVQGEMFRPELREVIVGESIAKRFPDAQVGKSIRFGKGEWAVVGVFREGDRSNAPANSEIWVNMNRLGGDLERTGRSSSLLIRATDEASAESLKKVIDNDQRLMSQAIKESAYYAEMTQSGWPLMFLGYMVAAIMAVGSAFAATNTMYAAVSRRTREIGTLRALGFSRWSIMVSFLRESVFLCLIGGVLGALLALPVNGVTTGIGNFKTFSETAIQFRAGPLSMLAGIAFSAAIGVVGGLLPAYAASKKNIIQAMREI